MVDVRPFLWSWSKSDGSQYWTEDQRERQDVQPSPQAGYVSLVAWWCGGVLTTQAGVHHWLGEGDAPIVEEGMVDGEEVGGSVSSHGMVCKKSTQWYFLIIS